jgi:amino-acid N-acetyltransferase
MSGAASGLAARELRRDEIDVMAGLLGGEGLAAEDIHEPGRRFFAFHDAAAEAVVGYGGLEAIGDGSSVLLRSVVVKPPYRRAGCGRAIAAWLIGEAKRRGARDIYLLTIAASGFFAKLGFEAVDRASVPAAVAASREFSTLCPASAVVMRRR